MTSKIITMVAIALFFALTGCAAISTTAETSSKPILNEAEAIGIAEAHVATLPRKPLSIRQSYVDGYDMNGARGKRRSPCYNGTIHTARFAEGQWIVQVGDCTFFVDDKTELVTSQ